MKKSRSISIKYMLEIALTLILISIIIEKARGPIS